MCFVPVNDDVSIPRPPISTLLAFDKQGQCLGMVSAMKDVRDRIVPDWMTQSADIAEIWTGWVVEYKPVSLLKFEWVLA